MWLIEVDERGARLVQGAQWAQIVGILMIVFGVLGAIAAFIGGNGVLGLVLIGLMAVPGAILTQTLGKHRERAITHVISSSAVAGGVNVTLVDETKQRHQLLTDPDTVHRILESLTSVNPE